MMDIIVEQLKWRYQFEPSDKAAAIKSAAGM